MKLLIVAALAAVACAHSHHDYKTPVDALAGIMVHDMEHHVKEMMEMKKAMKAKMGDDMMMAMGKEMEKHKDNIKMMMMHNKVMMTMYKMNMSFDFNATFHYNDEDMDGMWSEEEYMGAFKAMDMNGDDKVNSTEYATAFSMNGPSFMTGLYFFWRSDNNSDMVIDMMEAKESFTALDMDQDKMISMKEYKTVMVMMFMDLSKSAKLKPTLTMNFKKGAGDDMSMSMDEAMKGHKMRDMNMDGKVDEKEFVTAWVMGYNASIAGGKALFKMLEGADKMDGDYSAADAKTVFQGMDYDKSDSLELNEFLGGMLYFAAKIDEMSVMEQAKKFGGLDENMDRMVSMSEFSAMPMMWDTDMDGKLNATEFVGGYMKAGARRSRALYAFFKTDMNHDLMICMKEMNASFKMADMNMDGMMSFPEFKIGSDMFDMELDGAEKMSPTLKGMFKMGDANNDTMLSGDEMKNMAMSFDADMDGKITGKEFVHGWINQTHMDKKMSIMFFMNLDMPSMDNVFGDDDMKAWFNGVDYNNDTMISEEEWLDGLLWNYADIVGKMHMMMMKQAQHIMALHKAFYMIDSDKDEMISVAEFADLQKKLDMDGDKKVNVSEFGMAMGKVGMDKQAANYIFFRADENEDQFLDEAESKMVFASFDKNNDNMVSMLEYGAVMMDLTHDIIRFKLNKGRLTGMFKMMDKNMDGMLTSDEMGSLLVAMDEDKDGLVSKMEFRKWWMAKMGSDEQSTDLLFGALDADDDGFFGSELEKKGFFDGFDYNDDQMVSEDEFTNSMLFLYAKVKGELADMAAVKATADAVIGFFF